MNCVSIEGNYLLALSFSYFQSIVNELNNNKYNYLQYFNAFDILLTCIYLSTLMLYDTAINIKLIIDISNQLLPNTNSNTSYWYKLHYEILNLLQFNLNINTNQFYTWLQILKEKSIL
jgi:hypothetical protein